MTGKIFFLFYHEGGQALEVEGDHRAPSDIQVSAEQSPEQPDVGGPMLGKRPPQVPSNLDVTCWFPDSPWAWAVVGKRTMFPRCFCTVLTSPQAEIILTTAIKQHGKGTLKLR